MTNFFFFFWPKDIYWNLVNLNWSFHTIVGYSGVETNLRACPKRRPSLIKVTQDSFSNHKPTLGYLQLKLMWFRWFKKKFSMVNALYTAVTLSQYHHAIHSKYITLSLVNYISIKLKNKQTRKSQTR